MSQIFDEGKLSLADRHVVVHPPLHQQEPAGPPFTPCTVCAVFGATSQRCPRVRRCTARGARVSTSIGPSRQTKLSVIVE
jgi:hypothetical protein